MSKTLIDWVKNPDGTQGYTWNPITGCLNHINGMCKGGNFPCYAYKLANGRLRQRYLDNHNLARLPQYIAKPTDPFYPRFWPERFDLVSLVRSKPRGIFVCDMSDLFGIGIPEEWTRKVLINIRHFSRHRFYLLTKQPQNLIKFQFPENCWVGVTATNPQMFYEAQEYLEKVGATVRYISLEPFLERIWTPQINAGVIDWLIPGAQTKPYKPPKIEWVREIVEAANKASVPVFLKNNLRPIITERQKPFWYVDHYESHLRQELPNGKEVTNV